MFTLFGYSVQLPETNTEVHNRDKWLQNWKTGLATNAKSEREGLKKKNIKKKSDDNLSIMAQILTEWECPQLCDITACPPVRDRKKKQKGKRFNGTFGHRNKTEVMYPKLHLIISSGLMGKSQRQQVSALRLGYYSVFSVFTPNLWLPML